MELPVLTHNMLLFYRSGLHIPANLLIVSLFSRYGTTLLLYIVPVYNSPTLKLYFQIFVSNIPADIFLSRKRNGKETNKMLYHVETMVELQSHQLYPWNCQFLLIICFQFNIVLLSLKNNQPNRY
jgi:hypothetical protein